MLIPGIDGNLYAFKIDTDYENYEFQKQMYDTLWPKENPYIKKEKKMNNCTFDARERDKLLTELNTKNAHIGAMRHEIAELRKEFDQMETDLADAEERNNVKDALIDEQRKKIEELMNKNAFLNGLCSGAEVVKKENADLKKKLTMKFAECKDLGQRINDLYALMSNKNEHIRADHEKIAELETKLKFSEACNKAADLENAMLKRKIVKYEIMRQTLQAVSGFEIKI